MIQILILLMYIVTMALFALTQANLLKRIRPQNRRLSSAFRWIQVIPLIGVIRQFSFIPRLAASLKAECADRSKDHAIPGVNGSQFMDIAVGISYPN